LAAGEYALPVQIFQCVLWGAANNIICPGERKCKVLIFTLQKCNINVLSVGRVRMEYDGKLELKATIEVEANPELYKVIDFFNKNLKEKKLIFGLSKKDGTMKISIYET
jgi:hypothetical protein